VEKRMVVIEILTSDKDQCHTDCPYLGVNTILHCTLFKGVIEIEKGKTLRRPKCIGSEQIGG
jgi:hypothetical protein